MSIEGVLVRLQGQSLWLQALVIILTLIARWKGFPGSSVVKNLPANEGDIRDTSSIPGSGRYPGKENGNPLKYSCLENPTEEDPGGLQFIGLQRVRHY